MDRETFLEEYLKLPKEYQVYVSWTGEIRLKVVSNDSLGLWSEIFCPVTAVCFHKTKHYHPIDRVDLAAKDLNFESWRDIAEAADNNLEQYQNDRKQLMQRSQSPTG